MASQDFGVFYIEIRPTGVSDRYEFIYEIDASEEEFGKWRLDYMNKRICIEPKTYDAAVNTLRDILNMQKGRR